MRNIAPIKMPKALTALTIANSLFMQINTITLKANEMTMESSVLFTVFYSYTHCSTIINFKQ